MLRKKLEPRIDYLLGEKLREPSFLGSVLEAYNDKQTKEVSAPVGAERVAIAGRLESLKERKQRILETFFEGVIDKGERDARLAEVAREIDAYERLLTDTVNGPPPLAVEDVRASIEPFLEWEYLGRDDKRALLTLICPQISVSRYTIKSIGLNLAPVPPGGDEDSRLRTEA